jgi:hypothetical protein
VKEQEIDEILKRAAQGSEVVDPLILARVAKSIESTMKPVRPLPPTWMLTGGLALLCVAVAVGGAARAGFYGIEKLNILERAVIFPALGIFIGLAAMTWVNETIPGSRRRMAPRMLLGLVTTGLLGIFATVLHDYHTERFVSAGILCLVVGLLHAIPTGLLCWLVLRRGFAVDSAAAGLAAGTLAGLAGVAMLELHCANLQALHVLIWHTAVVLTSGVVGALIGWALRFRSTFTSI